MIDEPRRSGQGLKLKQLPSCEDVNSHETNIKPIMKHNGVVQNAQAQMSKKWASEILNFACLSRHPTILDFGFFLFGHPWKIVSFFDIELY